MHPQTFIKSYEKALASQVWQNVAPLIHPNACVTFSNGKVLNGKQAIEEGYTHNFQIIKNEQFTIANVQWLQIENNFAVYIFSFHWEGIIAGEKVKGAGRGTTTLVFEAGTWLLLAEHLG